METENINKDCKNSLKKTNQKTTTKKKRGENSSYWATAIPISINNQNSILLG